MTDRKPAQGRMSHIPLSTSVLNGFDITPDPDKQPKLLPGGAGTTYLVHKSPSRHHNPQETSVVFKPTHDARETEIISHILSLISQSNLLFRTSLPLRSSITNNFVFQNWAASTYIPHTRSLSKAAGEYTVARFGQILTTSRAFHAALRVITSTISVRDIAYLTNEVDHVWARAHRIVWSNVAGVTPNVKEVLTPFAWEAANDRNHPYCRLVGRLLSLGDRLSEAVCANQLLFETDSQLIHGDIVGGDNVLFPINTSGDNTLLDTHINISPELTPTTISPPVIIDFSPTMAPVSYAEGIMLADALTWCDNLGTDLLDLTSGSDEVKLDMLRRGLMFRCLSDIGLVTGGREEAKSDIERIERSIGILEGHVEEMKIAKVRRERE